jgi:AcrR family transcriptional regulator
MMTASAQEKRVGRRQQASEERKLAILRAGLEVFAARGFAAARLEDVAEKAGVAKGTIYLFFHDKEDLFEQIVLGAIRPVLVMIAKAAAAADTPTDVILERLFDLFRAEVLGTWRQQVLRLVITEGARFPRIAEFYHREVIVKGLAIIRRLAQRALARGELQSDSIARFPQLVFAPLLLALIWEGLFSAIEPLDVQGLLTAHRELLLGGWRRGGRP